MIRFSPMLFAVFIGCESPETACHEDEDSVEIASLPAEVTSAIETEWPGATILEAEQEGAEYEVEIRTTDGELYEVEITSAGEILEFELEEDHDDEDDDDEHEGCDDD